MCLSVYVCVQCLHCSPRGGQRPPPSPSAPLELAETGFWFRGWGLKGLGLKVVILGIRALRLK